MPPSFFFFFFSVFSFCFALESFLKRRSFCNRNGRRPVGFCRRFCVDGHVPPGFTGFLFGCNRLFPSFPRFHRVLLGFTGFYRVLPSFTGFYWVLLGLNWAWRVGCGGRTVSANRRRPGASLDSLRNPSDRIQTYSYHPVPAPSFQYGPTLC